jgi:hypothetical protein
MPGGRRVVATAGISLALIALMVGLSAAHVKVYVGPSPAVYFLAFGLPQAVILISLRKDAHPIALAVAGGIACVMTLLCAIYSFLGFVMASWNFGGYRPPDWYWIQWLAGCVLLVVQLFMGWAAVVALSDLTSLRNAVGRVLGGVCVALVYLVVAFAVLRYRV